MRFHRHAETMKKLMKEHPDTWIRDFQIAIGKSKQHAEALHAAYVITGSRAEAERLVGPETKEEKAAWVARNGKARQKGIATKWKAYKKSDEYKKALERLKKNGHR